MKWNHEYTLVLSIGFTGQADQRDYVVPSEHIEESEWNAMTNEAQSDWLCEMARDFLEEQVEYFWEE